MSISREQLLKLHTDVTAQAREVMTRKNHDYAHEGDVFRNFRYFGGLGILVRLSDKLARLRSFDENGTFKVKDEKLLDTIIDAINYAVIYLAFKEEEADRLGNDRVVSVVSHDGTVVKSGPYCESCERIADFRHANGTFWCRMCVGNLDKQNFTLLERF